MVKKPLNSKQTINVKNYLKGRQMSVLEHVKDNQLVFFVAYHDGNFVYETSNGTQFNVSLKEADELGLILFKEDKAINFMKWIKRKIDNDSGT